MPIRQTPPTLQTRATTDKIARKMDEQVTKDLFRNFLLALLVLHFLATLLIGRRGLAGYLASWKALALFCYESPLAVAVVVAALFALYKGLDLWRHPDPVEVKLPPYPPVPDLRWQNSVHIGSGWTRSGKQPGDTLDLAEDELLDDAPHVIVPEKGLFGNLHVLGGVGGGKTSTLIMPFIQQAIQKFPKPPLPDAFRLGTNGRYEAHTQVRRSRLAAITGRLRLYSRNQSQPDAGDWTPYAGMTPEEAKAEYDRLLALHHHNKWGLFVIDPKGDMTEFVQRVATLYGREDDVVVLRPDGEYTYNPLVINTNPLVQSQMVMDGIEAVSGQATQQYYRQTMSEWLANALAILRAVDPTRINFKSVLSMARSQTLRVSMVAEAEAIMRQALEEEERLQRVGKRYTGPRVNPAAVEFFRDWDDVDADQNRQQAVVSGLKSQSQFFVDDELAPFLCPEMPATFSGFDEMFDRGKIVVLRLPLDQYGPVAKVVGILVLADAQQAARARINRPDMNQDRVVAFLVDEVSAYLNKLTKDFIAMNRQSRVAFVAAHQSLGQLIQQNDRSAEQSFADNLRTRISFNAPNADAARRLAAMYGSRKVWRESWSESHNFAGIEQVPESDAFKPKGSQSKGASVRIEEVERFWFEPEDFVGLKTGELIIREFDGQTTLPPRKIKAPAFFESQDAARANALTVATEPLPPHPIVVVPRHSTNREHEYINAALGQAGYVICEPLANRDGELEGFKFVTPAGTVIVPCEILEQLRDVVQERLTDPRTLVVFTDTANCAAYFSGQLGFAFERVIGLVEVYRSSFPAATEQSFHGLFAKETGTPLPYPLAGSWEYHTSGAATPKALLGVSRAVIGIFTTLGDALYRLTEDALESIYEQTRESIYDLIHAPPAPAADEGEAAPTPDVPERYEVAGELQDAMEAVVEMRTTGLHATQGTDTPFNEDVDPFGAASYPDALHSDSPAGGASDALLAPDGGQADPTPPRPALDAAPQRLSTRRRKRSNTHGDLSLFDDMPELRLSPLATMDPSADDDAPSDPVLPSTELPVTPTRARRGRPKSKSPTGSTADVDPAEPGRPARRRNARPTRGVPDPDPNQSAFDLGLPSDPPTGERTRGGRTRGRHGGADMDKGAPLD